MSNPLPILAHQKLGQNEDVIRRKISVVIRHIGIMRKWLEDREFAGNNYSNADMAIGPWIAPDTAHDKAIARIPNLGRRSLQISARETFSRKKGHSVESRHSAEQ